MANSRDLSEQTKYDYVSEDELEPSGDTSSLHPGSRYVAYLRGNAYVSAINAFATGCLLDLGCGRRPLRPWYDRVTTSSVGIDWSDACRPDVVGDLRHRLPFADTSFDTILASDVLEHLPDIAAAFQDTARLLRPAGRLIVGTPFLYMIHEAPHDYSRPTEHMLRLEAGNAGLTPTTIEPIGGAPDVAFDLASKFLARGGRSGAIAYRSARTMASLPLVHRMSERTRHSFPLGYLAVFQKG